MKPIKPINVKRKKPSSLKKPTTAASSPAPKVKRKKTAAKKTSSRNAHSDASLLPEHYAQAKKPPREERSDIDLTEQFVELLPGRSTVAGRNSSGVVRDHRDYVDEPFDADGKPRLDFRFCSNDKRRAQSRNENKGFLPVFEKDRKIVPPGTPGAKPVVVAGAKLCARKREVAEMKRAAFAERISRISRTKRDELAEELVKKGRVDETKNTVEQQLHYPKSM